MNSSWIKYFLFGVLALLVQVLFLNNINIFGLINPKIYPIFLLLLPRSIKPVPMMVIGFFTGMVVDMFSMTMGIGMASSVFICFFRPYIFRLLYNKRDDDEQDFEWQDMGLNFLVRYLFFSLLIFHFVYFVIEMGEVFNIFYILLKSILSTVLALFIYVLGYLLVSSGNKEKSKNERKF